MSHAERTPPCVIVHDLAGLRAVMAVGAPFTLLSAPSAGVYAGVAWWQALMAQAGYRGPSLLDCGDAAGRALAALRAGQAGLVLRASAVIREEISARGAHVLAAPPPALDMAQAGAARQLAGWLAQNSAPEQPAQA